MHASASIVRRYAAGGLILLLGLAVVLEARTFGLGTLARVGPGLFPMLVGGALGVIGLLIAVTPEAAEHEGEGGRPDWRGWFCIVLGIVLFMVLGEHLGLGPATFACVFVSALGDRSGSVRAALVLALAMTVVAGLVFTLALKFQMPFWRG
ncbi:tripartite tricarboxylate transporter TctB family protein [Methylobacterium sp. SyP6R]|uniref:tripartite tricarboxylate transporter TctB family protein n=1 Tax=Methylobacterium sp. SyP6R TaxID=2718876 RepID=UPI001F2E703F|nr:tripartite tricarboxylate transporter TctB family protein [Methylobacterium sp. SyP6R]MCF4129647.1 tripartite tricarboxylate transporter TctB family protein [Methylobacterium sp. SyP6R]